MTKLLAGLIFLASILYLVSSPSFASLGIVFFVAAVFAAALGG
jgi:uncharacterized membrane protein YccC